MWLTEIDPNGNIVKTGIRNVDEKTYELTAVGNRLVNDPLPTPNEYNARFVTPIRVTPVTGDVVEYTFEQNQLEILSPEEQAIMNNCLQKAKEFLDSKGIDSSNLYYFVTVHDATVGEDIAMVFTSGKKGKDNVKVSLLTNSVSEWYELGNFEIDGDYYFGVSKDLVTGDIIDKYKITGKGQEKITPEGKVVITHSYNDLPSDEEQLRVLNDFKYRDHITGWSDKDDGFIIQYDRMVKRT